MRMRIVVAGHALGSKPARVWLLTLALLAAAITIAAATGHNVLALMFLVLVYVVMQIAIVLGLRAHRGK